MKLVIAVLIAIVSNGALCYVFTNRIFASKIMAVRKNVQLGLTLKGYDIKTDKEKRDHHIYLLDCLMSDLDDSSFDNMIKTDTRARLLHQVKYADLCVEMESKGLPTSGDKIEMLVRLLNYEIDPYSANK